jgi:hypothetical protein
MWQALAGFVMNKLGQKNQQGRQVADSMANGIQNVGSNLGQLDWNNAMQFPEYKGFGGF